VSVCCRPARRPQYRALRSSKSAPPAVRLCLSEPARIARSRRLPGTAHRDPGELPASNLPIGAPQFADHPPVPSRLEGPQDPGVSLGGLRAVDQHVAVRATPDHRSPWVQAHLPRLAWTADGQHSVCHGGVLSLFRLKAEEPPLGSDRISVPMQINRPAHSACRNRPEQAHCQGEQGSSPGSVAVRQ
jgi:hypothetical protein